MIERDSRLEKRSAQRSVSAENTGLKFIEQIHPRFRLVFATVDRCCAHSRLLSDRSIGIQQVRIRPDLFHRPDFVTDVCCLQVLLSTDINLVTRENKAGAPTELFVSIRLRTVWSRK